MTVLMIEPTDPKMPTFCIWKCWWPRCKSSSRPLAWEGRWSAYREARDAWYAHLEEVHEGIVWPGLSVTVRQLLQAVKDRQKPKKKTVRVKRGLKIRKRGW